MQIKARSIIVLCACAIGLTNAIHDDYRVFDESDEQPPNGVSFTQLLKNDRMDPAFVARVLSEEPDKDALFPHSQFSISDLLTKINRFKLEDCAMDKLKARLAICEQFKNVPVYGFTFAKENVRLYCREAFEQVVMECVRRTDEIVTAGTNEQEYMERLRLALQSTWDGHERELTLERYYHGISTPLERFILQ